MSRVDFYVLSEEGRDASLRVACQLAEEAVEQGRRVYVQTASLGDAQRLDDLLWTFNDRAFLPHEINHGNGASHPRVMILLGETPAPATHRQLLINLSNAVPADLGNYEHIAEIVAVDAENKRFSRERYKRYRELGCELGSHNL